MLDSVYHPVKIKSPVYADEPGTQLHRYLETEFIPRFQQDTKRNRAATSASPVWRGEVAFSEHDQLPVLGLPVHHTYHIVSCEVQCDQLGSPALDPAKVSSAGFVVRRVGGSEEQAWTIEDGKAIGWQAVLSEQRDPDVNRRLCTNGVLRRSVVEPTYSGEEIYPMHTLDSVDSNGKRHTVLYGYLPLGGFYYENGEPVDADSLAQGMAGDEEAPLPPFAYARSRKGIGSWTEEDARPVHRGEPTVAMFTLLRLLVNRYHLGEEKTDDNHSLEQWAKGVFFYDDRSNRRRGAPTEFNDLNRHRFLRSRRYSLLSYLNRCFAAGVDNPLIEWISDQEERFESASSLEIRLTKLPARPDWEGVSTGNEGYSIYISSADAQEIQSLLRQRLHANLTSIANEIPIPKFRQRQSDQFQVVPFVRVLDEAGKERTVWGDTAERSEFFRVAAPFDPDLSRPSVIQMPGLKDLKRGLAKGANMIVPPDTFNVLKRLKPKKGASEEVIGEESPTDGLGVQWIYTFSLPVITIVAMILLMIMVSLLNIVFYWLPWVYIRIPLPKIK